MNYAVYSGLTPLEIFRKIAFELKSFPDDVVNAHIELAEAMFCAEQYGDLSNLFLALMAAHLMVIPGGIAAKQGTGSAPAGVKSIKEGDLQITYQDSGTAATAVTDFKAWLALSRFGQLILMLRRTLGLHFGLTVARPEFECGDGGFFFPNRVAQ